MVRTLCAFYGCLLIAGTTQAGSLSIVATGDSNTTGYAPIRLTLAMQAQGISGTGYSIASGGSTATLYVGKALDTNHKPEPAFHNQAEEAINGPVYGFGAPWTYGSVIAENPEPDAVIVMLGTNDAIQAQTNPSVWTSYQIVDGLDYTFWADHFSAGSAEVSRLAVAPEPAAIVLTGIGGLLLAAAAKTRRNRFRNLCLPWRNHN